LNNSIISICNSINLDIDKLLNGILEGINDIIGVYKPDNTILFYNKSGYEFFNTTQEKVVGKRCFHMLNRENRCNVCTTQMALEKGSIVRIEKYIPEIRKYMECTANPVFDDDGKLILIIEQLRDITEEKLELERAASIQRQRLSMVFPLPEFAAMEAVYVPAKAISGDFYHVHKVDEHCIVGLIGDVSGKGISAALSISAMKVLFYEALQYYKDPSEVLSYMNNKVAHHFPEDYVAACCFKLDFKNKSLCVSCAAINEFMIMNHNQLKKIELPGPFLGMFENIGFEQREFAILNDSKLYFYTDGFQMLTEQDLFSENDLQGIALDKVSAKLNSFLAASGSLKDDCTLISIEMKEGL
jgi:PAS domain S-box-containing protein